MIRPMWLLVRLKVFRVKYTAIMASMPGNRFRITAKFIRGLRILKRMTDMA